MQFFSGSKSACFSRGLRSVVKRVSDQLENEHNWVKKMGKELETTLMNSQMKALELCNLMMTVFKYQKYSLERENVLVV